MQGGHEVKDCSNKKSPFCCANYKRWQPKNKVQHSATNRKKYYIDGWSKTLKILTMANSENLRICHINCQSLFAHIDEFRHFFVNAGYHIICLSETWLRPMMDDDFVSLSGYTLYRRDRVGRIGGGVGFYIQSLLYARVLEQSQGVARGEPEFLIAEISLPGSSNLLLAVVYRPLHCGHLSDFSILL